MSKGNFQIILYVVFGFLVIVGFSSLALYGFLKKGESGQTSPTVDIELWGTLDEQEIQPIARQLSRLSGSDRVYANIFYTEKSSETIEQEYIESVAFGTFPDLLLLDHATILRLRGVFEPIPFSYFPLARYRQTFVESAGMFVTDRGYLAVPFLSDALVLYYNENIRLQSRLQFPPALWSDFTSEEYLDLFRKSNDSDRAVIPLGAYGNYAHAVDLFLSLLLQVREREGSLSEDALQDVLSFYTSFADSRFSTYAWNIALPDARDFFIDNRLLFYPGYIGEYHSLRRSNPNIVIRTAPLPQFSRESAPVTMATLYGFAIPKASKVPVASTEVIFDFLGVFYDKDNDVSELFSLPPAIQGYSPGTDADIAEKVFADTLFSSRSVDLSREDRARILETLRDVTVGVITPEEGAEKLFPLIK